MLRYISLVICMLTVSFCFAQHEKFTVIHKKDNLVIEHKVKKGETVFSVARRYHVPPSMLADINNMTYKTELKDGATVDIPLAVYNHINEAPDYMGDVRPLYYKVGYKEDMSRVVKIAGVPQRKIEKWNNLPNSSIRDGQELMVGWVLFDNTPVKQEVKEPDNITRARGDWSTRGAGHQEQKITPERTLDNLQPDTVIVIRKADTVKQVSEAEELYLSQTMNEQRVIEEKGPATFFASANSAPKSIYAFHNTARKGSIIKVFNPGTGKSVFVKVIGAIPATAQYYNSIIGISAAAKRELGVKENKMFCEITYGVL
jgi:murein DD-endopeptidase MepM/ murein hydrolase activator NlpD